MRFLMWAAPLLAIAAPAFARSDTGAAAAPAAAPAKPKTICRSEQVTGRRIAQSRCYTAAQWAELDRVNSEAANKLLSDVVGEAGRSSFGSGSSGGLSTASLFGLGQ